MAEKKGIKKFVLCVENKDCEDLEKRKIYQVLPDDEAEKEGYLRVIDESGEDYLYPSPISSLSNYPARRKRHCRQQVRYLNLLTCSFASPLFRYA